jgi:trk system potassium uptake protein
VATVPWSTDRLMRMLLPDGVASAWREPTGTVAILPLPVNEDWIGRPVRELETATGSRVAFIVRFGTGVLPRPETFVQAEDTIYVAAVSGTVSDVTAAAAAPPPQEG